MSGNEEANFAGALAILIEPSDFREAVSKKTVDPKSLLRSPWGPAARGYCGCALATGNRNPYVRPTGWRINLGEETLRSHLKIGFGEKA